MAQPAVKKAKLGLPKVSVLGGEYSLTYIAAQKIFEGKGKEVEIVPCKTPDPIDVIEAITNDSDFKFAVLPLESSTKGPIKGVLEGLLQSACTNPNIQIVAEVADSDDLCLCGPDGITVDEVKTVVGHQTLLEACREYLRNAVRGATLQYAPDSVTGVEWVKSGRHINAVSVANKKAAINFGMNILKEKISDDKNAETRYIVLSSHEEGKLFSQYSVYPRKVSTAVALKNIPGSLFKLLSCMALREIPVLRLESRPASLAWKVKLGTEARTELDQHWSQIFFLEFKASEDEEINEQIIRSMKEFCLWIKVFGKYPTSLRKNITIRENWAESVRAI